jgi:hypothetical protein
LKRERKKSFSVRKIISFFRAAPNIYLLSREQAESRSPMNTPNVYALPFVPGTLILKGGVANRNVHTRLRSNK